MNNRIYSVTQLISHQYCNMIKHRDVLTVYDDIIFCNTYSVIYNICHRILYELLNKGGSKGAIKLLRRQIDQLHLQKIFR